MAIYKVIVSYTGFFIVDADDEEEAFETARELDSSDCELDAPEFLCAYPESEEHEVEDISSDDFIEEGK